MDIESSDAEMGSSQGPQSWATRRRVEIVLTSLGLMLIALLITSNIRHAKLPQRTYDLENFESAAEACGPAPWLDGEPLDSIIQTSSSSILVIANPEMRCTQAVVTALQSKGMSYTLKKFQTPFQYMPGASDVWDWLHCSYPDDKLDTGTIMHSYVFFAGHFQGQGFEAADKVQQGLLSGRL